MKISIKWLCCIVLLLGCAITLSACGSDDDESSDQASLENNLPEASRAFIGYWRTTSNYGNPIIFFTDGTGLMLTGDYEKDKGYSGYWTYDATTKVLATTMASWQFNVTLSNDNAWAGVTLNTGNAVAYERGDSLMYMKSIICESSWETDTIGCGISYTSYWQGHNPSGNEIYGTLITSSNTYICLSDGDFSAGKYTCKYTLTSYSYSYNKRTGKYTEKTRNAGEGTITIENPFTPSKMKLVFTGRYNATLGLKFTHSYIVE